MTMYKTLRNSVVGLAMLASCATAQRGKYVASGDFYLPNGQNFSYNARVNEDDCKVTGYKITGTKKVKVDDTEVEVAIPEWITECNSDDLIITMKCADIDCKFIRGATFSLQTDLDLEGKTKTDTIFRRAE